MMKNKTKMPKKYMKTLSNIFLWTRPTDPLCNMLQNLKKRRKYIGVILSDENTPYRSSSPSTYFVIYFEKYALYLGKF